MTASMVAVQKSLVMPDGGFNEIQALSLNFLKITVERFLACAAELRREGVDSDPPLLGLLNIALKRSRQETLSCFSVPAVATPIHAYAHRENWPLLAAPIKESLKSACRHLLLELSRRELLPEDVVVTWDRGVDSIACPDLHAVFRALEASRAWCFQNGALGVVGGSEQRTWARLGSEGLVRGRKAVGGLFSELGYVTLSGPIRLALVDYNPIATTEQHPEKNGNVLDLGEHSEEDWRAALSEAFSWIEAQLPDLHREMQQLLQQIVPVGYCSDRHYSASYRESIGSIYLTLHPRPLTLAEAVIHEYQHNKLNLLSYGDSLLNNAFSPLYPSPIRPDPRPLWGILLAAHAFVPVALFYRKLRAVRHPVSEAPYFDKRLAEIDEANAESMATLKTYAEWTDAGKRLFTELTALWAGSGETSFAP